MSDQPHDEPSGVIVPPPGNRFTVRVERHQLVNAYGELDAATRVHFAAALSPLAADGGVIGVKVSARDFWVPPGSTCYSAPSSGSAPEEGSSSTTRRHR